MELKEKAAYLKGLADGLEYDNTTKEGKLIAALIDLTQELCAKVDELDLDLDEVVDEQEELREYIEEIDDDLNNVEEFLDEEVDLDDEEDSDWDDSCDGNCEGCDGCDDLDEEDGDYFEITCPSCGETICFDETVDPENLTCPACNEKFACVVEEDDLKKIDGE